MSNPVQVVAGGNLAGAAQPASAAPKPAAQPKPLPATPQDQVTISNAAKQALANSAKGTP